MKFLILIFAMLFAVSSQAETVGAIDSCYVEVEKNIQQLDDESLVTIAGVGTDTGVAVGSVLAFVPTMGASIPIGAGLIVGRNIGNDTVKEISIQSREKVLQLIVEAEQYVSGSESKSVQAEAGVDQYQALQDMWYRVNGPFAPKYSHEEVAVAVLAAAQDESFCQDSRNFRFVHFKDYVMDRLSI